jgi:hypothetical protein
MSQSGEYVCQLTDILGRLILERDFSGKLLELSDPELPAGVFIATVFKNGQRFGQVQIVKLSR